MFQAYFYTPEKNCKNLKNYAAKQQKSPKMDVICKMHDVDKSTLVFGFNSFFWVFCVFLVHPTVLSVLLSASVERFDVSRMREKLEILAISYSTVDFETAYVADKI